MPTNSYDLIVIGGDFAGLVAAALCAKRGMRVLIVAHGAGPYAYQIGSHKLPIEPVAACGLQTPAIKRVIGELHLSHTLKRKLVDRPVSFQLVTPDTRLDVHADDVPLASEFERELRDHQRALELCAESARVSDQLDPLLSSVNGFPPTGFWQKREVNKSTHRVTDEADAWLGRAGEDALKRALVSLPGLLSAHVGEGDLSALAQARAFHTWRQGVPRLRGDMAALREMILEKLYQANGEFRQARVAELGFSWGKISGVRLESGEDLGAAQVIAALPADELMELTGKKTPKRLTQCAEAMSVTGYRYVLNLLVHETGIPEGMSSPVLVTADPTQPLTGDNAIAIYLEPPDDEARVAVTVSAVCAPPAEGEDLDDVFADLRVRLRERLEMVMPFFSEHVIVAHSPNESTPPEGLAADLGHDLPVQPAPVWSSTLDSALGVTAMPYSVGLKNLVMASDQVLPHLGLEGSFTAGWCAARLVCNAAGKKRDYLKDEVIDTP